MTNPFGVCGINGEAGHGKDLVADWLCDHFHFCKVGFADVMKRFSQKLFNFTDDQLWGPSDKRNAKDDRKVWDAAVQNFQNVAGILISEAVPASQGIGAYKSLLTWFSSIRKQCEGGKLEFSPRTILQTLGTEWGRNISPDLWSTFVFERVLPLLKAGYTYSQRHGVGAKMPIPYRGVVIADVRFISEINTIKVFGGTVARVKRMSLINKEADIGGVKNHVSEKEMKGIPDSDFDYCFEMPEGTIRVYEKLNDVFPNSLWRESTSTNSADLIPEIEIEIPEDELAFELQSKL